MDYVVFCPKCGKPTEVSSYIMKHYITNPMVKQIYCQQGTCFKEIKISDRFRAEGMKFWRETK